MEPLNNENNNNNNNAPLIPHEEFEFNFPELPPVIEDPEPERIDPPNCMTYGEWRNNLQEDYVARPPLHRQSREIRCIVIGCGNFTSNSCRICMLHHPVQEVDNFPCYIIPSCMRIIDE